MSHVILFHSALGLRPAVHEFADALRAGGHEVTTPDLFEGATFDDLRAGVACRDAIGIQELSTRAVAAVEGLPHDLVYAGFSMGAASAQMLALTRPGARGAVLMHAVLPPAMFGAAQWPVELPAQIHFAEEDPWVDATVAATIEGGPVEVFRYPGAAHLFADAGVAEHDAVSARLMCERVQSFLRGASSSKSAPDSRAPDSRAPPGSATRF